MSSSNRGKQVGFCLLVVAPLMLLLLGVSAACQGKPSVDGDTTRLPTTTPGVLAARPTFTPEPSLPYELADIPLCTGLQAVSTFRPDWPDIDSALEKLAKYNWGYYRCGIATAQLTELIKTGMIQPPYNWQLVNTSAEKKGEVTLFYQPVKTIWVYIWMLPGPDIQSSLMVIAKGEPGFANSWECRLPVLPLTQQDPPKLEIERTTTRCEVAPESRGRNQT